MARHDSTTTTSVIRHALGAIGSEVTGVAALAVIAFAIALLVTSVAR